MKRPVYNKLPLQLALHTAAVTLLLAIIVCVFVIIYMLHNIEEEQRQVKDGLIATTLPAFNLATFNYNSRLNQNLAEGLISHPGIISAIVLDTDGSILAQASHAESCAVSPLMQLLFNSSEIQVSALEYAGTQLGKLVIELSSCQTIDRFKQGILRIIAFCLLFTTAVALFIYITFYRRVTRPLTRFAHQLAAIDAEDISPDRLLAMGSDRNDELGSLMNSTTHLLELLRTQIDTRRKAEKTISEYSARLETLIHKRTDALTDINRRLSQNTGEQTTGYTIPLLSVVLPSITETVSQIQPLLDDTQQARSGRLLTLLQQLSNTEQSENVDILSLSALASAAQQQYPQAAVFRRESPDQLLLPPQSTSLLISALFSVAAGSNTAGLVITASRRKDDLILSLSGDQFFLSCDNLNAMITGDLTPGPALLSALCRSLAGQMEIKTGQHDQQLLECRLPVRWLSDELAPILRQLHHTPLHVDIHNDIIGLQVKRWLNDWNVPFCADSSNKAGAIILTDQPLPDSRQATFIPLSVSVPARTYLPTDLLNDLQQLLPHSHHPHKRRREILLVDDNTINRMLCQRYLKNLGITPETAENGLQALELARQKHYDLILMDCQMPVMDGFEATRQIRRHSINRETPIIALTGLTGENERQKCLTAGMNDYIGKPFTQDQIQATLIQWVDQGSVSAPPSDG